jgi:hypothetical protein
VTRAPDDGASRRSEHRLVIVRRHADGDLSVLLLKSDDAWVLPRVELPEHRSADVRELNRAAGASLGLETSVLRCLADEPGTSGQPRRHLHLLEAHARVGATPRCARWMTSDSARAALVLDTAALQSAERWIQDAHDWTRPGWRDEVLAWVGAHLDRRRWPQVSKVEQIRTWEFSQVLVLQTSVGQFYFKARPASGAHEAALTRCLAAHHPASTPDVIAIDSDRGWLLMRATAGPTLTEISDVDLWASAVSTIAEMQIDWLGGVDELLAVGCPRVAPADLEAEIGALVGDTALLQPRHAVGLADPELAALRARRRELEALCGELGARGVPLSLEHGDLWAENVIAAAAGPVFIDWEDASIAHPFFTPALLLLSLEYSSALRHHPDARRRLRDAYLHPWANRGPLARWSARRLEDTFDLAEQVAMIHYAEQFRRGASRVHTSWEVRGYAPMFLRRLLAP